MAKKQKYYVVWEGVKPGIYTSWSECQVQIKGFANAKYKSFPTKEQAKTAYKEKYEKHITKKGSSKPKVNFQAFKHEIIKDSISVDAACSGNPGIMEYRGVITMDAKEIFRIGPFQNSTNNVGEFLALIHGLAYLQKNGKEATTIYTDSRTAMSWVRNKKVKTLLKQDNLNQDSFELIERGLKWLNENKTNNPIVKWNTKKWGEIPADFGRK